MVEGWIFEADLVFRDRRFRRFEYNSFSLHKAESMAPMLGFSLNWVIENVALLSSFLSAVFIASL